MEKDGPMTNPEASTLMPPPVSADIQLAARWAVPVLVSAPPDRVLAIVHAIAAQACGGRTPQMLPIRRAPAGDGAVNHVAAHAGNDSHLLWISDVDRMDPETQRTLSCLLRERRRSGRPLPRIIASSSVDLYGQVGQHHFDRDLFYALNAIHIVEPG
jgi:hypothetical protein